MRSRKFVLFIFVLFLLVGGITLFYLKDGNLVQASLKTVAPFEYQKNIEINIGEEIPTSKDYSEEFSKNIIWLEDNMEEQVKKVGVYQGAIPFGYHFKLVNLTVVDKEPPIIENVEDVTIFIGDTIKLEEQVKVSDNSKEEIKLSIKGDYSFDKAGIYTLTYEAIDQSGNIATADFKLIVKEKEKPKLPTSTNSSQEISFSSKGYKIQKQNGAYYVNGILVANKTYDLSSSYAPGGLTRETIDAFEKMKSDASKEGISLKIISGYRSYSRQKTLYNNYVKRDGKEVADRYSARPGHSEHQTGLAFDVNSLDQAFGNTKAGEWLNHNCYKYGFILRYPKGKEAITGYMYEPWHFRYIGQEAINLYNNGVWTTLEEYLGIDSKYSS